VLTVSAAREGAGLTKTERLIYEEIARVRYLVGHGFRMLIGGQVATPEGWKKITADADYHKEVIADDLLCPVSLSRSFEVKNR
jgi:hypothetical protein